MTRPSGVLARAKLALLACALIACIPGGALRLSLCVCNGILVDSPAAACPCEHAPESESACSDGCCAPEPACPRERDDEADDCCTHLPMPDLLGSSDGAPDPLPTPDFEAWPDTAVQALEASHGSARAGSLHATGPPDVHRVRRALAARASVVLLI